MESTIVGTMTTTVTMAYEGAPACVTCQEIGHPVCDHVGFTARAFDHMLGRTVHVPGLDDRYKHWLRSVDITDHRKTVEFTVDTERPPLHDLARHLSIYPDVRAKAAIRAVHHQTGDVLQEGAYDRFLRADEQIAIDRTPYHVDRVEHPNRNALGFVDDGGVDLQVAHLVPIPAEQPVQLAREDATDGPA